MDSLPVEDEYSLVNSFNRKSCYYTSMEDGARAALKHDADSANSVVAGYFDGSLQTDRVIGFFQGFMAQIQVENPTEEAWF